MKYNNCSFLLYKTTTLAEENEYTDFLKKSLFHTAPIESASKSARKPSEQIVDVDTLTRQLSMLSVSSHQQSDSLTTPTPEEQTIQATHLQKENEHHDLKDILTSKILNALHDSKDQIRARKRQIGLINTSLESTILSQKQIHRYAKIIEEMIATYPFLLKNNDNSIYLHKDKIALPFSLLMSEKGAVILLKRHDSQWVKRGGQKTIKKAIFIPINSSENIQEAVEAITDSSCERENFNHVKELQSIISPSMYGQYKQKERVILPRYDGDLSFFAHFQLSTHTKISISRQILTGLTSLHKKGIIHYDIKLENILARKSSTEKEYEVVIADLGSAEVCKKKKRHLYGTHIHSSPDLITEGSKNAEKADIWAVGKMLYCLFWKKLKIFTKYEEYISSNVPFLKENIDLIKETVHSFGVKIQKTTSRKSTSTNDPLLKIIIQALRVHPTQRPSSEELLAQVIRLQEDTKNHQ